MPYLFDATWHKRVSDSAANLMHAYRHLADINHVAVGQTEKTQVWQDGRIALYRYRRQSAATCRTPLLVVYAMVNRYTMMDLQPDRSFIGKLLAQGLDVYLVDWGTPTLADRYKNLDDYLNGYLNDMLRYIARSHQTTAVNVMGICQGGTLSIMYAALHPDRVKNLITLVTPVDFDVPGLIFKWAKQIPVGAVVEGFGGVVPGSYLNFGFDLIRPMGKVRKYLQLDKVLANKESLLNFLRMEQWVSESPPQSGEAFRQFVEELYIGNKLLKNAIEIGGKKVDLQAVTMPVLTIYAAEDHIVLPESTKPLHQAVGASDKTLLEAPGGHIGVFVGSRSQQVLAPAIADWLFARDA